MRWLTLLTAEGEGEDVTNGIRMTVGVHHTSTRFDAATATRWVIAEQTKPPSVNKREMFVLPLRR